MALSNFYLTDKGNALLARAQAGTTLTITRAQVGEGTWPEGTTYANIAALVKPIKYLSIVSKSQNSGQVKITVQFSNSGVGRVFQWTEFGLWAADPDYPDDRSRDILYGTAYAGDTPVPIESALTEFLFNVLVKTGQAANVTVTIDSSLIYLTQESLDSTLEALKGQANGLAELGEDGKVPEDQLPEMDYDPAGSAAAVKEELENDLKTKMQHFGNITGYDTVLAAASALTVDGTFFGDPSSSIYNATDKPPGTTDVQYFVMLDGTTGRRVVLAVGYAATEEYQYFGTRDILNGAWLNEWRELAQVSKTMAVDPSPCTDLDTFIQVNKYMVVNSATQNIPAPMDSGMVVNLGISSSTFYQVVYSRFGETYVRGYADFDSVRWKAWQKIATTGKTVSFTTKAPDEAGWKVIGSLPNDKGAQVIQYFTSAYSEATGFLILSYQWGTNLTYIGADLGSNAMNKFRLTADLEAAGTVYLEGYLGEATTGHIFKFDDLTGGMTLNTELVASTHPYVRAELDISGGGLCLSKPLQPQHGGTGAITLTPDPGGAGVRAISAGTTDMTAGSSPLATGQIHLVYG